MNQFPSEISIGGRIYRPSTVSLYRTNTTKTQSAGALIDGGANGGLLGSDARVLETDLVNTIDAIGVTNDAMTALPIVQAAAKILTVDGKPIIAIFSSYAQRKDGGRTIHSKSQMESFGIVIDDRAQVNGGSQCIVTNEGYVIPIHIRDGLPVIDMVKPSNQDMDELPHVFMTADMPWKPQEADGEFDMSSTHVPKWPSREWREETVVWIKLEG